MNSTARKVFVFIHMWINHATFYIVHVLATVRSFYQPNSLFSFESAFFSIHHHYHYVHLTASEIRVKMAWVKCFLLKKKRNKNSLARASCIFSEHVLWIKMQPVFLIYYCIQFFSSKKLLLCSLVIFRTNFFSLLFITHIVIDAF